MWQAEALAILAAAGIDPDKGNDAQLLAAILALIGARQATEVDRGTARVASQAVVDLGEDDERFISALKLRPLVPVAEFAFTGATKTADLRGNATRVSSQNNAAGDYFEYVLEFAGLPHGFSLTAGPGGLANFVISAVGSVGGYEAVAVAGNQVTLRAKHPGGAFDAITESISGVIYMRQPAA